MAPIGDTPATTGHSAETLAETQMLDVYARAETAAAQGGAEGNVVEFVDAMDVVSASRGPLANSASESAEPPTLQPERFAEQSDVLLATVPLATAWDNMPDEAASSPSQNPVPVDGGASASDDTSDETPSNDETTSPPVATLAYNLANMLVQSLPPNAGDAKSASADSQSGLASTTNADHAAQEGRAA